MIVGLTQLFLFWILGEAIHYYSGLPISGPVLGMMLLFAYLMISKRCSEDLQTTSQTLISQLSLLLLPGCAGLFFLGARMDGQWLAVLGAIFIATTISIVTSLWLMKKLVLKDSSKESAQ